jgi:hypothetical protein
MTDKHSKAQRSHKGRKAGCPAKSKTKDTLMGYTRQLASIGVLQQAIVKNIQKEIENV